MRVIRNIILLFLITHYSFDSLSHQALPALPTPVMLSEAKHLSVSTDCEILHYVQNDIDNDFIDTQYVMLSEAKHLSVALTSNDRAN